MDTPPSHARHSSLWAGLRLVAAALITAAILAQLTRTIDTAAAGQTPHGGHLPTVVGNFFSFFTIQSNVAAVVALAIGSVWAWRRSSTPEPRWLTVLFACTSTYMIVTGLVYNVLLRGIELPQGATVPWSNEVLHVVGPLVMLADLMWSPGRRALAWRTIGVVVSFPILWVIYTLVRANLIVSPVTGDPWWYPYPFLDPHVVPGGYAGVAGYATGIAVVICAVAAFVVWVGRREVPPVGRVRHR